MHNVIQIIPPSKALMRSHSLKHDDRIYFYLKKILENQYYTESGPLVLKLEERLGRLLCAKNVVAVSNVTIAWLLLLEGAGLRGGKIFISHDLNPYLLKIFQLLACRPISIELESYKNDENGRNKLSQNGCKEASGILLTNRYSGVRDLHLASMNGNIDLQSSFLDSTDSFLSKYRSASTSSFVKAEVISLAQPSLVKAEYVAAIATNSDSLAHYLRCMRGSGGVTKQVDTTLSANGRMSEGQGGLGLAYLDVLNERITRNKQAYEGYNEITSKVKGITVLSAREASSSAFDGYIFLLEDKDLEASIFENLKNIGAKVDQTKSNRFTVNSDPRHNHFVLPTNINAKDAVDLASLLFGVEL